MDLYMNWACLLSTHGHKSVRSILQGPSSFIFILFSCPLHPFWSVVTVKEGQLGWRLKNYRLTVQCSWVNGWNDWVNGDKVNGLTVENADVIRCTNIWQVVRKHLWRMTHVVFLLVFISDRSVTSFSMHFSYKNHPLLLSFPYFSQKHIVKSRPSYLSEIYPFNSCILRSHPFTLWLGK